MRGAERNMHQPLSFNWNVAGIDLVANVVGYGLAAIIDTEVDGYDGNHHTSGGITLLTAT